MPKQSSTTTKAKVAKTAAAGSGKGTTKARKPRAPKTAAAVVTAPVVEAAPVSTPAVESAVASPTEDVSLQSQFTEFLASFSRLVPSFPHSSPSSAPLRSAGPASLSLLRRLPLRRSARQEIVSQVVLSSQRSLVPNLLFS